MSNGKKSPLPPFFKGGEEDGTPPLKKGGRGDFVHSELILGGQKSGKSRRAESLADHWLSEKSGRRVIFLATGEAWDEEMKERIARHKHDRATRAPYIETIEEPYQLTKVMHDNDGTNILLIVDCLTMWLTNRLMSASGRCDSQDELDAAVKELTQSVQNRLGPVILVSNEISLGVIPLNQEVRRFVDSLGLLNQTIAGQCQRVTFMAAGLPIILKDEK